jgi:hypothetical protein
LSTETGRVEICFTSDSRLLAGVAGAVNHVAEAAGLDENARAELVAAVEDACQEALAEVSKENKNVALSVDVLPDRIEAAVEFKSPSGASQSPPAGGNKSRHNLDSVRRENNGGNTRIILSKKLPH